MFGFVKALKTVIEKRKQMLFYVEKLILALVFIAQRLCSFRCKEVFDLVGNTGLVDKATNNHFGAVCHLVWYVSEMEASNLCLN